MTAYISRLFSRAGPSAGIRPRPRSRYEPEPETYLGGGPVEIDWQYGEEELSHDRTPKSHAHPRHAADPAATLEGAGEPGLAQTFSVTARRPVAAVAAERTTAPAPPDQHRWNQLPNRDKTHDASPALRVEASVRTQPAEAVPAPPPSISHTPARRVAPGDERRSDDVAVSVHPATPPAAIVGPGQEQQSVHVRHPHARREPTLAAPGQESQPPVASTRSATSPDRPVDLPADTNVGVARRSATPEPIRAARSPRSNSPDPVVRQTIVDAIAEPARGETTEVVVHIDRIDVRTASSTAAPPPEPRRPRAAPTSLQSYLRARSRGAGR